MKPTIKYEMSDPRALAALKPENVHASLTKSNGSPVIEIELDGDAVATLIAHYLAESPYRRGPAFVKAMAEIERLAHAAVGLV
jgi:hypothetical protein